MSPDSVADQPHGSFPPQEALLKTAPYIGKIYCICIDSNHLEGATNGNEKIGKKW